MLKKINQSVDYIKSKIDFFPEIGIVLGSGIGGLINEIDIKYTIDYKSIPNFPVSTVEGHKGQLVFGVLGQKNIVAMQGRFHYYEGYSMQEITFPIRVMKFLGIKNLILSNATGGLNPDFEIGDIMIVKDHINLFPDNPLIGINNPKLGERFPDMNNAYDKDVIDKALDIAQKNNINVKTGVLLSASGPCYETPAEYKFMRLIGADAVGMSVIPEVIVARQMKLSCFAISIISDLGIPGKIQDVSHEKVIQAVKKIEPKIFILIKNLIYNL
ncbi:MAG: purine-nucleoside phosphorylase [Bacteroidales bacterium]|nr:purine-nucleoside phosphorylase [Bacteroidales bacterium]